MVERTVRTTASDPKQVRYARIRRGVTSGWRRLPFTASAVLLMLLVGLGTGSLWHSVVDRSWFPNIAYGVAPLVHGRWWTVLTGPLFARTPAAYLGMLGAFALLVGFAEWWIGTRRVLLTTVVGQIVGVLTALLFLLAVRDSGWSWAARVGAELDVGFSAGALAGAA
ncbi:MAG: hypothetical protein M3Y19_06700, partial [Actinomycetota bacterium]|nr:hypothetical protein [Actinomycetota bacterium]